MPPELLTPWREFLVELDAALDEVALDQPVQIHCLGGFVLAVYYGMPRPTKDIDFCDAFPSTKVGHLLELGGEGSRLARKHRVYLQSARVGNLPEDWPSRLQEMFPGFFAHLRLFVLDPYDLVLSKLERNTERDRDDVRWLARNIPLDPAVLRQRYETELRLYLGNQSWHDQTLRLWLEDLFPPKGGSD